MTAEFGTKADKEWAFSLTPVSRETRERLEQFVEQLLSMQSRMNLVANSTLAQLWSRHVADSLQLLGVAPKARVWADLGSGGGFPGVVLACALANTPGAKVHLIESVGKKANFLREVVDALKLPAQVHQIRAELFAKTCAEAIHAVTARALAPLKILCDQAFPLIAKGSLGVFPKGQHVGAELTEAAKYWSIEATQVPSLTSIEGRIVVISGLKNRGSQKARHQGQTNRPKTRR
jgi:16S rRNA (guanine527-N7)-methyltransferase